MFQHSLEHSHTHSLSIYTYLYLSMYLLYIDVLKIVELCMSSFIVMFIWICYNDPRVIKVQVAMPC